LKIVSISVTINCIHFDSNYVQCELDVDRLQQQSTWTDLESGTVCQWTSDFIILNPQPFQTVTEDVFIWSVGPKHSV